jgi:glycosyltransferase involved in cell wall biosynthesis
MKVAIVHDYIKEYGGAERVLEELIRLYPDADVYTSLYAPEYLGPHEERFKNINVKTTFLNSIPGKQKLISPLRLLSPFAFKNLDLRKYDVIIVSQTGAYFPNLVQKGRARLICYTHTPPRYLYGYKTARSLKNPLLKAFSSVAFHVLRMVDFTASKNVDEFIANSEEVKARIEKFYRRSATVIYPPVSIPDVVSHTKYDIQNTSYYLAGGRLARAKGMDIIVKAFNKNGLSLRIFGKGFAGFEEELKRLAHKNIEFVGEVNDEEKFKFMASAKAFVFASFDEDFGITPVEAMGVGTPVIAFRSGGVKETVIDGKTGVFFDENTPESLNNAISRFENLKQVQIDEMEKACVERAEKFSEKEFDRKIREVVKSA